MLTGCGENLTDNSGILFSPGYPDNYLLNIKCVWRIIVKPGLLVQFNFTTFNLESNVGCTYDYVKVSDSAQVKYGGTYTQ